MAHGSGSTSGGNSLEAQIAGLQDTLALLVVASAKTTSSVCESKPAYMSSSQESQDWFEYEVVGEMLSVVAIRSQMKTQSNVPMVGGDTMPPKDPNVCPCNIVTLPA